MFIKLLHTCRQHDLVVNRHEFPHNAAFEWIPPLTVRADKGVGGAGEEVVGGVTTNALPSTQSTKTVCVITGTKEKQERSLCALTEALRLRQAEERER